MGASGSYTQKATINPNLFPFTKWGKREIEEFRIRGNRDLADTFALRRYEFDFLVGKGMVSLRQLKILFEEVYDTNNNKVVDKYELMCSICLLSKLSNEDKIHFLFDLFNFNHKGYLLQPEISLLLLSVTSGASKADPKFVPPPPHIIASVVNQSLQFAIADPGRSLRKPELVLFTASVVDVNAYLEAWTGYAGQVLLRKGLFWRDLTFPACINSITPTNLWLTHGLPPTEFVRWVRLAHLEPGAGCTLLFTHKTSYLKTIDKQFIHEGAGLIATGTIKSGLLADRWLLNAYAVCITREFLLTSLFSLTGQESEGRFCLRLYEGFSWKTIFIDDRIPCTLLSEPLFSRSSDTEEAWPLLVEKGVAKYLGSYGHIGSCARRSDAQLFGLRLLTGGHVYRKHVHSDLVWHSVSEEAEFHTEIGPDGSEIKVRETREDGAQLIISLLKEGSLVAFGISELCAIEAKYLRPRTIESGVPHGPFGFMFPVIGHEVVHGYIYLIIRDAWGLIVDNPAAEQGGLLPDHKTGHCRLFKVKVEDIPDRFDTLVICRFPDSIRDKALPMRLKPWRTSVAGRPSRGLKSPAHFKLHVVGNVKDKPGNSKRGPVTQPKAESKKKLLLGSKALIKAADNNGPEIDTTTPVDIAFTFSSACPWAVAGAPEAGASLRVRIIRSRAESANGENAGEKKRKKKRAQVAEIHHLEDTVVAASVQNSQSGSESKTTTSPKKSASDSADPYNSSETEADTSEYDSEHKHSASKSSQQNQVLYEYSVPKCWMSFSLKLPPGDYHVFADVRFKQPAKKMLDLLPLELNDETGGPAHVVPKPKRPAQSSSGAMSNLAPPHDNFEETPINRVLMQTSTAGMLDVRAVMSDEAVSSRIKRGNLENIRIPADRWPFYLEIQQDTASRGLTNMITALRQDAEAQAIKFLSLMRKKKALEEQIAFALEEEKYTSIREEEFDMDGML